MTLSRVCRSPTLPILGHLPLGPVLGSLFLPAQLRPVAPLLGGLLQELRVVLCHVEVQQEEAEEHERDGQQQRGEHGRGHGRRAGAGRQARGLAELVDVLQEPDGGPVLGLVPHGLARGRVVVEVALVLGAPLLRPPGAPRARGNEMGQV
eukprot:CAMPEP_0206001778 /NCGR_PEP_ID=MMETSP1464-20131121/2325_1 /ASSEMBLY_ACC=CAM_ASM_001124 /TAXON_ID=119497 /ORGANISM="Exanthemachrysis gayraliae, Strain RCC1523" /LENGTH=149 /DNA_ID=CAMNT_0053375099 /DNA_START=150 /DNA_END=599 /DNA_ORIENTATION=+